MTTAPTNEMMAEAAKQLRDACVGPHAKIAWPHRILHETADLLDRCRLAATPARDVREALEALIAASKKYLAEARRRLDADIPKDAPVHPVSAYLLGLAIEIGDAQHALSNLDAAAPAAGGDERGHDWDGQYTAAEFIEIANEKYNLAKNGLGDDSSTDARALMACSLALRYAAEHMFAAPPLQAPAFDLPKRPFAFAVRRAPENGPDQWRLFMDEGEARAEAEQLDGDYEALFRVGDRRSAIAALQAPAHSDAVREALERIKTIGRKITDPNNLYGLQMANIASKALTAPAAKAPAVSEADVGRVIYEVYPHYEPGEYVEGFSVSPGGYLSWDQACARDAEFGSDQGFTKITEAPIKTANKILALIQSAAQGGGHQSDGGVEGHAAVSPEIPTQRSGASRDPLGDGSVKVSPHREDAAGIKPGPSDPPSQEASAPPIAGGR